MSSLKIVQIRPSETLESRKPNLNVEPSLSINVQSMALLTYDVDALLEIVSDFLEGDSNRQLLVKTLKVLGSSLNDSKIANGLQKIILDHLDETQKIYEMIIIWSELTRTLGLIILKMPSKVRKILINIIFTDFLFKKGTGQSSLQKQLPQLLSTVDQNQLTVTLKDNYHKYKEPLVILLTKSKKIKSQNSELNVFLGNIILYALSKSDAKLFQLLKDTQQNSQLLNYVLELLPSTSQIVLKNLSKTINIQNVLQKQQKPTSLGALRNAAVKEWMEDGHNYWKTVDKYFIKGQSRRDSVVKFGQQLEKQNLLAQSLSIKYLFRYFQGSSFEFDIEDVIISASGCHQSWTETYKSISHCLSAPGFNLIAINVTHAIKNWPACNPFQITTKHKGLSKFIEKYQEIYQSMQKQFKQKNKKIGIAYSTLIINVKDSPNNYIEVTFQQLKQHLEEGQPLETFRKQYKPFLEQIAVQTEPRKDHNIIIQARIVRILKRSKQSLTLQELAKSSGYQVQVTELALQRLCNKDIAQTDQNQKYSYIV